MLNTIPVRIPHILTIGDSYSDGRSGIQVDLKTFTTLSTFGLSVITALASGTTYNVKIIHEIPEESVASQFLAVTNSIEIDALKIGMNFSSSLIECILSLLTKTKIPIIVIDPIMTTNHLSLNNLIILRDKLLPVATLITLTVNEISILLERDVVSIEDIKNAARDLHRLGPKYVLISDDHLVLDISLETQAHDNGNNNVVGVLFDGLQFTLFKSPQVSNTNAHDIRCTLSAATTAYLARSLDMIDAVQHAITYAHSTIQTSLPLDRDNSLFKTDVLLFAAKISDDSLCQQKSQLESVDKVVIVSNQGWIYEPRVLLQKRSFVQLLKNACSQEWFDYTHHPFVKGLANGTLLHTSFKHYLIQDYIFLTHFARCYALAAYKSKNMSDILRAAENVCNIGRESKFHLSYCTEWGIDTTNFTSITEARANLAYTRFTLDCGMSGDLLDLHVALSPCLLGYGEIGLRLFNDSTTNRDSPYWKWILSYAADDYQQVCHECEQLLERLANEYGIWYADVRMKNLIDTFKTATNLEIGFWNMGLHVEW